MSYTRKELFQKYKENDAISERYFHKSNQWTKYSKEERDNFWKLYQKYADIAYNFLVATTLCEIDGVLEICSED